MKKGERRGGEWRRERGSGREVRKERGRRREREGEREGELR